MNALKSVRYVLADMDATLTAGSRLPAVAYDALERLTRAGIKVFVATASPAGWCDQMVRTWPVEGVIGENGGLFFRRGGAYGVLRHFWNGDDQRRELFATGQRIAAAIPGAALADDQPFRLATLAFDRPRDLKTREAVLAAFSRAGLSSAESGRVLLGWTGGFDKLAMAKRVLGEIDDDAICCCGDPGGDAALFDAYSCAIDSGFVAAAEAILLTREAAASARPAVQRRSSAGNMAK
jgi:hydroxymethylpyrimidine pyrophosphatase-like HAD family hydrolase